MEPMAAMLRPVARKEYIGPMAAPMVGVTIRSSLLFRTLLKYIPLMTSCFSRLL